MFWNQLKTLSYNKTFLKAWDEIEIEDEIDTGKQSKSKISVPVVCSPLIQQIIFDVSQQLVKMLPYTMIQ